MRFIRSSVATDSNHYRQFKITNSCVQPCHRVRTPALDSDRPSKPSSTHRSTAVPLELLLVLPEPPRDEHLKIKGLDDKE